MKYNAHGWPQQGKFIGLVDDYKNYPNFYPNRIIFYGKSIPQIINEQLDNLNKWEAKIEQEMYKNAYNTEIKL